MSAQIEYAFQCPHCGSEISMLLEPESGSHAYTEDCEVCCRPLSIRYVIERPDAGNSEVREFEAVDESS